MSGTYRDRLTKCKARDRAYKLADGGGMYLLVTPQGGKYWRLKYRFAGKEKVLALGVYPEVRIGEARDKRDAARRSLRDGLDPAAVKVAQKRAAVQAGDSTFEAVAREWFAKFSPGWAKGHSEKVIGRLKRDVFPWLGSRPIAEVKAADVLAVLRRIEQRGVIETAHRALQNCSQVFRYAVVTRRAERDPTADLRGALPPASSRHHAAITEPKAVGALIRAIRGYDGLPTTKAALVGGPGIRPSWRTS